MKANVNLELSKEDLSYELGELIREIASKEIHRMVKEQAESMVKEEVRKIVAPIVESYLEKAKVGREMRSAHDSGPFRNEADVFIKQIIQQYLDEPTYLYSQSSDKLSERYALTTSDGRKTRAEMWVIEKARNYAETELKGKMHEQIDNTLKQIMPSEDTIQQMIQEAVKQKFA